MRMLARHAVTIALSFTAINIAGCSGQQPDPSNANRPAVTQTNTNSSAPAVAKKTSATGTILADPNPIKVCDGSGSGVTSITWSALGTPEVEIRIGAPDGGQFARSGPTGKKETGKWVGNGTVIYLQDVWGGKPLTSEYTIATVTINLTTQGCP